MRKFTFALVFISMTLLAAAQSEVDKRILQSFSTEGIETIIVKIDGEIEFKNRAVEILAETGDYDVLTADGSGKMLLYDNPNAEYIYFKGERQTMDIKYTIHVPEGVRVIDVFRNDLLASK